MSAVGVVEQVAQKDVTTKFGLKPTFSLKINGGWVKCGFKNPKANVGDTVQYEPVSGTYGVETKSVVIISSGGGAAPVAAAPTTAVGMSSGASAARSYSSSSSSRPFPIPALHGDRSIVRQNALARATELVIAVHGGKPFEVDEAKLAVIINIARQFESYTTGDIDLAAAEEAMRAESKDAA